MVAIKCDDLSENHIEIFLVLTFLYKGGKLSHCFHKLSEEVITKIRDYTSVRIFVFCFSLS